MPIAQQLTLTVPNRPGALARVCETLAARKINIVGLDCSGPQRQIRMLVNKPAQARRVLEKAGQRPRLEPVLVVRAPDQPGALARIARKLAARKININYAYATVPSGARRASIVLGVANPGRAARLVG
ncbi:MAG: ACT domain-containing protein [Acidobacteria bacterium]|nr:ACT domain-containing protein [Acidobacteriota bacterium]